MDYLSIFDRPEGSMAGNARLVAGGQFLFERAIFLSDPDSAFTFEAAGPVAGLLFRIERGCDAVEVRAGDRTQRFDFEASEAGHRAVEISLPDGATRVTVRCPGGSDATRSPLSRWFGAFFGKGGGGRGAWLEGAYRCEARDEDLPARLAERVEAAPLDGPRLCQLTDVEKWKDPEWMAALESLESSPAYEPPDFVHRKSWEWGQCMYGLDLLGKLNRSSSALGVGVGWEPISFFLTRHVDEVVATDLYPEKGHWSRQGAKEGNPEILDDPDKYAPFPYEKDRVRFLRMDGKTLDFPDERFDLIWSCSSIEHFGGHEGSRRAMREIERVLKPGGVVCLITEYVLPPADGDGPRPFHPEFFNLRCLYEYLVRPVESLKLVQAADLSIPDYYVKRACRLPAEAKAPHEGIAKPHIVLAMDGCLFTSVALFFRKEGGKRPEAPERLFALPEGAASGGAGDVEGSEQRRRQRDHMKRMMDIMDDPKGREAALKIMRKRYRVYLKDLFPAGVSGRILDVGCGYAEIWYRMLRERGLTYYGADLHEDVIEFMTNLTREQGDETYIRQGRLEEIPFPEGFFDVVYASHILEHTVDIARALAELKRILKDNGILIFAVPCGDDDEPAHTHNREKEGWVEDLTAGGFVIETWGRFDFNQNEFYGRAVKK